MAQVVRLGSWNVNGIRAAAAKPGFAWFHECGLEVIGLQEIKAMPEQFPPEVLAHPEREAFICPSVVKKGYSGTAAFTTLRPLSHELELPDPAYQGEGRIVHLEFERFHFFNGYFPNGGAQSLDEGGRPIVDRFERVPYKMGFFESFLGYAERLRRDKPIVVCGDFNIAHREIDLANPAANRHNTGFLDLEREFFTRLLGKGYIDTFRLVHGDEPGRYSWWSYKTRARERNVGWRIDYFLVSEELRDAVADATIEDGVTGSDHCPVTLTLHL
ncbi:MAG: exodeoxyribonuclease III [Succinivibrionaceae bacterium]|nr:exodeoxyribonuclease III [Succinivibrionaceae bacterium]